MAEPDGTPPAARRSSFIDAAASLNAEADRLGNVETAGSSPDRRVLVRVTGQGRVTDVRLLDGVLRRYDRAGLDELVTRTVRGTQRRARAAWTAATDSLLARFDAEHPTPEPPSPRRS